MGVAHDGAINPAHIVAVRDCSAETLREIVAHLEASTQFEHLVYREAELDAIWSLSGFVLSSAHHAAERDALTHLHDAAHQAHDLVGKSRPLDAARLLRSLL